MKAIDILAGLNGKGFEKDLEKSLTKLIREVRSTGKGGKINIKIGVAPLSAGQISQVQMGYEMTEKLPTKNTGIDVFFCGDDNTLEKTDQNQMVMGEVVDAEAQAAANAKAEVTDPITGEIKAVDSGK